MAHEMPGIAKALVIAGSIADGGEITLHINRLPEFVQQLQSTNPDLLITATGLVAITAGAVIDKIAERRREEQENSQATRRNPFVSGPNPMHDGRVQHRPRVPER